MSSMTAAACPARLASSPKHLFNRLRHDERGVLDIELIGFVPILVLVTMFLVQGFFAVSTVTSVSAAARDGARAGGARGPAQLGTPGVRVGWLRFWTLCSGHRSGSDRHPIDYQRTCHRDSHGLLPRGLRWHYETGSPSPEEENGSQPAVERTWWPSIEPGCWMRSTLKRSLG